MLRIVTDGAADLPTGWEETYQIDVLPLHVIFGEEVYTQGPGFTRADFYRMVREKRIVPKTSLPSIGQVKEFYTSIAEKGDTILSIHISSKLSGTFATVESAARELANDFNIHVFDSAAGSVAQAFLVREARLMQQAGAALPEILRRLEWICQRWVLIFTLDTLEYARLSGRINALQSLLAYALKVKPIIVLKDGLLDIVERVRTRQRSLDRVIEIIHERLGSRLANLVVVHANDPQTAQTMLEKLKNQMKVKETCVAELAIPIAVHLGPGAIGVVAYPLEETH